MNKVTKARKYNSPQLQELLEEITPLEMEQTKVKMQLSARIEDYMRNKGWNKTQFAEQVRKNPSEITKWLSGTQNFTVDVLTEIAFTLGVEIANLFGRQQIQDSKTISSKPGVLKRKYQRKYQHHYNTHDNL